MSELTHQRLLEIMSYDPETGFFSPLVDVWKVKAGERAGGPHSRGYRRISVDGVRYFEHRLAWFYVNGSWPEHEIDHINCDKADNRICNLRAATPQQNSRNCPTRPHNKTGLKGVHFYGSKPTTKPWRARIHIDKGVVKTLGYFATKEEAHAAYVAASEKYHGEFARVA